MLHNAFKHASDQPALSCTQAKEIARSYSLNLYMHMAFFSTVIPDLLDVL